MPDSSFPVTLQRSDWRASILLVLRLLLAADLARLTLHRWNAFDASLQILEVEGFPAPNLWLATAILASAIGIVTLLLGWPPWIGTLLPYLALFENILLGFGLMGLFFFGAGRYTLFRGLRVGYHRLVACRREMTA